MMRMTRQEAQALFGLPPKDESGKSVRVRSSDSDPAGPPAPGNKSAAPYASPEVLLARALPRLWRYALARAAEGAARVQRQKLRELLVWVLSKRGFRIRERVQTPYELDGAPVQGRLELLVESTEGSPLLAVETDFTEARDSVLKLESWHNRNVPVLWVIGKRCAAEALYDFRLFANRALGRDTRGWLRIYHLEHGWLTGQRKSTT